VKLLHFHKKFHPSILDEKQVDPNPIEFFRKWFKEAIDAGVNKPEAMDLATVGKNGKPSSRVVLLKSLSEEGFRFFTNYDSKKARDIEENQNVALLFHWTEIEREVRIEGYAVKTSDQISDEYFDSRPLESRISAIISPQSKIVSGRDYLDNLWNEKYTELKDQKIPRPSWWGGYNVIPERMEFWQTAPKRLNDRVVYVKKEGQWKINRLAP
jgi:pyridoxamine 5'-phosphate oxidase